jgi:hypothetical protein
MLLKMMENILSAFHLYGTKCLCGKNVTWWILDDFIENQFLVWGSFDKYK